MADFRAFYCAGAIVSQHRDPYHTQPLYECESGPVPAGFYKATEAVALPAPLPGYALALFVPLAKLPYKMAVWVWAVILASAVVLCIIALTDITGSGAAVVLAAISLSLVVVSVPYGELVSIVVAALSAAAAFLKRGKPRSAAAALMFAMIEPHLALPAVLAVFLWTPRARFPLLVGVVLLAALSLSVLGVGQNIEYLLRVLPAHALAEAPRDAQFSFTYLLHRFGVADRGAVLGGEVSYFALMVAGIALCGKLRDRWKVAAITVALPAAFSVIGGPFIHVTQIAAAVPLALLVVRYLREYRVLAVAALLGLAVPWQRVAILPPLIPLAVLLVGWLTWRLAGFRLEVALRAALASAIILTALLFASAHASPASFLHPALHLPVDASLAEGGWAAYVRSRDATGHPIFLLLKLPTWIALVALMLCCVLAVRKPVRKRVSHSFEREAVTD